MVRALEPFRAYLTMIAGRLIEPGLATQVEASDLVQETFLAAHRGVAGFQGSTEAEWRGWLKAILINRLANLRRAHLAMKKWGPIRDPRRSGTDRVDQDLREPIATPSAYMRLKERDQALEAALSLLPEHYNAVVRLHSIDGLSFEAVGARLGVTGEAARKTWIRALMRLQKILGPDHDPR